MPPRSIGPYRILSVLGAGGIGCVYRATDRRTGEEVALKLLSSGPALDPMAARRMAREFEALHELSHPNVVRVFDTGVYRGYPYLTMELVDGLTLREYLSLDWDDEPAIRRKGKGKKSSSSSGRMPTPQRDLSSDSLDVFRSSIDDDEDEADDYDEDASGAFNLDRLAMEPDTDPGIVAGRHASGQGPEALRRLADAIDEPMTDETGDHTASVDARKPPAKAARPAAPAARPDTDALTSPARLALLKDALVQICQALAYIHGRGMVHRDLKPSNIMVDEDRRVKLMDFGLAKFLAEESSVTAAGRIVGTYRYMAPEQLLGERLDGRADLYSMGVMLYELLAGRPPFDAKTALEMAQKVLEQEALPLTSLVRDVDEQLARIAHRLMQKDPNERYQTAEEIWEVLNE